MTRKTAYTISYILLLAGAVGTIAHRYCGMFNRQSVYIACMTALCAGLLGTQIVDFLNARPGSRLRKFKAGTTVAVVALFIAFLIETAKA